MWRPGLHHYNITVTYVALPTDSFIPLTYILSEAINELFCHNEQMHDYNKRQRKNVDPVTIRTKLYVKKTISFQGRSLWNNLPSRLNEISSLHLFKSKLKRYLLGNY